MDLGIVTVCIEVYVVLRLTSSVSWKNEVFMPTSANAASTASIPYRMVTLYRLSEIRLLMLTLYRYGSPMTAIGETGEISTKTEPTGTPTVSETTISRKI